MIAVNHDVRIGDRDREVVSLFGCLRGRTVRGRGFTRWWPLAGLSVKGSIGRSEGAPSLVLASATAREESECHT